jgi:hypothetical protein
VDTAGDVRRWKRLLNIDLGQLNVEKIEFVVQNIGEAAVK